MTKEEFISKVQQEISPDVYVQDSIQEDVDSIMYAYKGKKYYVCAIPKNGVRVEHDPSHRSIHNAIFPNVELLEAKISKFIRTLPENIDLYEEK